MVTPNKTINTPAVSTVDRDSNLSNAPEGSLIFNSDTGTVQLKKSVNWEDMATGEGIFSLQDAYDNGPTINMDSNVNMQVFSSSSDLAFAVVEGGASSSVECLNTLKISYDNLDGPSLVFDYPTVATLGGVVANVGGETQASNTAVKNYQAIQYRILDNTDSTFETETTLKNYVAGSEIECFSSGPENKSFRDLNMQGNPITNAGVVNASILNAPTINVLGGSVSGAALVDSQAITSSFIAQLNQIEQTDPTNGGFLSYNIFNGQPAANFNISWERNHSALNDTGGTFTYNKDEFITANVTTGSESGQRNFWCANNGTLQEFMRFSGIGQVNMYKNLDMSGNDISVVRSVQGANGYIDFQNLINPSAFEIKANAAQDLSLNSDTGNILLGQKVVYIKDGQVLTSVSPNTTYVFLGTHTFTSTLTINQPGVVFRGTGRDNSKIEGAFSGALIDVVNEDFEIADLTLTASGDDTFALTGSNFAVGQPNNGRTKTLNMHNCQLRNCKNGVILTGFDLVDFSQTLFYYFEQRTDALAQVGVEFRATSKVELTSCEFLRWFEEATFASPINFFVGDQVKFVNDSGVGFGAVNMNGCLFHPQQNQNGVVVDNAATFGFANITSCSFIDINLNVPTFLPLVIDIELQPSWIIEANQGVPNYKAFINTEVDNNATVTTISAASTPTAVLASSFINNGSSRVTLNTATGVITKDSKRSNYFSINLTGQFTIQSGGNNQNVEFGLLQNGTPAGPTSKVEADANVGANFTFNVIGFANQNDTFQLYCQNNSGANDILVNNLQLAGVES